MDGLGCMPETTQIPRRSNRSAAQYSAYESYTRNILAWSMHQQPSCMDGASLHCPLAGTGLCSSGCLTEPCIPRIISDDPAVGAL